MQEKLVFNNLVLLSKWNFVDIQFPVFVYKSKGFQWSSILILFVYYTCILYNSFFIVFASTGNKVNLFHSFMTIP